MLCEYCNLGITFTGSSKLWQKGHRSYFSLKLKRMIDIRHKAVLFKFFDALVQPVASYGCQVRLPSTGLFKLIEVIKKDSNRWMPKIMPIVLQDREQKDVALSWFKNLEEAKSFFEHAKHRTLLRPRQLRFAMKNWFLKTWQEERTANRKLSFYNSIKLDFAVESYLNLDL